MGSVKRGLSLIEVLIVVAIIGILAAVLVPNLLGSRQQGFDAGTVNCGRAIQAAQTAHYGRHFEYAKFLAHLDAELLSACAAAGDGMAFASSPVAPSISAPGSVRAAFPGLGGEFHLGDASSDYSILIWDARGSTAYLVTQESVVAKFPSSEVCSRGCISPT